MRMADEGERRWMSDDDGDSRTTETEANGAACVVMPSWFREWSLAAAFENRSPLTATILATRADGARSWSSAASTPELSLIHI